MNTKIRGYLENITLGIIGGLLTNVVAALLINILIPDQVALKHYKTISLVLIVLITPFLINYLIHKFNISLRKIAVVSLTLLIILLEAIFFSTLPTQEINIDQNATLYPKYSNLFEGVVFKRSPYNKVWTLDDAKIGVLRNELHILLKVEWDKEEKRKGLERNYKGHIYYQINLDSNISKGESEMKTKITNYSFRPGSKVLSYIIGFIDTGYLIQTTNDFTSKIEEIVTVNKIVEQIKDRT